MAKYTLTISHDDSGSDDPFEFDTLFKLHMFSSRLHHYTDPDVILACPYEFPDGHEYEGFQCDEGPHDDEDHVYVGPKGFFVSYFEHGQCQYGLAGTMSGMPDFRWDGVEYAGFLEIQDQDSDWFNSKSDAEQRELAASMLDTYTKWANGEVYGYTIEENDEQTCNLGHVHREASFYDSCWGFIGDEWFVEEVRNALPDDATEDNTEVVDQAYGLADYVDFFEKVDA